MKNNKLKNGISEVKNIKMTSTEKEVILNNIFKLSQNKTKAKTSPWVSYSFMAMIQKNRYIYYIILPLILILSSGGVVYASQSSLPDSILYPLKTRVVEPVEGILSLSSKAKAKHEINLAKTRLVEAETLATLGKLDNKTEDKINTLLNSHTKAFDKAIEDVSKKDVVGEREAEDISKDFHDEMNKHSKILKDLENNENDNEDEQDESRINKTEKMDGEVNTKNTKARDNNKEVKNIESNDKEEKSNRINTSIKTQEPREGNIEVKKEDSDNRVKDNVTPKIEKVKEIEKEEVSKEMKNKEVRSKGNERDSEDDD